MEVEETGLYRAETGVRHLFPQLSDDEGPSLWKVSAVRTVDETSCDAARPEGGGIARQGCRVFHRPDGKGLAVVRSKAGRRDSKKARGRRNRQQTMESSQLLSYIPIDSRGHGLVNGGGSNQACETVDWVGERDLFEVRAAFVVDKGCWVCWILGDVSQSKTGRMGSRRGGGVAAAAYRRG